MKLLGCLLFMAVSWPAVPIFAVLDRLEDTEYSLWHWLKFNYAEAKAYRRLAWRGRKNPSA